MPDRTAYQRILAVTEEELCRIILDIHDGPVQKMFAALSQLTFLQQRLTSSSPVECQTIEETLDRVCRLLESSLQEIKTFVGTFRPPEFHKRPLLSVVSGLIIQHEELTGSIVEMRVTDPIPRVALPVKIALYRVLQEALSNVYRHAQVNRATVNLWAEGNTVCMTISDRGRGFDPPPLNGPQATEQEEHVGLRGMRERVALVGGSLEVQSRQGQGTQITVRVSAYG